EPRELTRVPVRLVRVVDENPDQLEVGMLPDASERELADIARAPLCDSVRHGRISLAGGVALQDRRECLPWGSLPARAALPLQRAPGAGGGVAAPGPLGSVAPALVRGTPARLAELQDWGRVLGLGAALHGRLDPLDDLAVAVRLRSLELQLVDVLRERAAPHREQ